MSEKNTTLRSLWSVDLDWTLTDSSEEPSKEAIYKAEHIFELLSKNIFQTQERDDFKRLSVALSDYLKMVNFIEEINPLQIMALSISFGYYYRKLEEKHIVKIEGKNTNDKSASTKNSTFSSSSRNN